MNRIARKQTMLVTRKTHDWGVWKVFGTMVTPPESLDIRIT
jgi:hypothetical protein